MEDGREAAEDVRAGGAPRVDRRVLRTRAAIETALRKLVKEQGLKRLTVSSLAREADIDRKTFYLHYDSVDDLFDQITEQLIARVLARVEGACDEPPRAQVAAGLDEVNAIILEDPELYRHIAANLSLDVVLDKIGRALAKFSERFLDPDALEDGRTAFLARFYLVGAVSAYSEWLRDDRGVPISWVSDQLVDVQAAGLERAFGKGGALVPDAPVPPRDR